MKTADGSKKRKPPTFRHLPENRAKKLKHSWVETQKIKSQWKAQKRKEGIVTKSSQIEALVADHHEDDASSSSGAETGEEMSRKDRSASPSTDIGDSGQESNDEDGGSVDGSADEQHSDKPGPSRSRRQQHAHPQTTAADPPLRNLQKQTYSKTSPHPHKSGPLPRRWASDAPRGGHSTTSGRGRGRGGANSPNRGRGQTRGRGRGQPDMRLRMNAMLEKIKRDMT